MEYRFVLVWPSVCKVTFDSDDVIVNKISDAYIKFALKWPIDENVRPWTSSDEYYTNMEVDMYITTPNNFIYKVQFKIEYINSATIHFKEL
jgi:hypothetical protein